MSYLLLVLMMMVTLVAPLAGPRNRPPIANDDLSSCCITLLRSSILQSWRTMSIQTWTLSW